MRVKHPIRTMLRLVFRRAPVEAQLIVTRRCNLSCGYCTEYDKVSEFIPLEVLKRRIDALHRLRVINIAMLGWLVAAGILAIALVILILVLLVPR